MNQLEIREDKDKALVVSILAMNGYAVRIVTVKDGNKPKKVIQYEKTERKNEQSIFDR